MSLAAMTWALDRPIEDSTALRTLLVLADHASDTGLAYPRCSTVAERAMRSADTISRHLSALEDAGYIARYRLRRDGQLRGYLFRVLFPGAKPVSPGELPRIADGVDGVPDGWDHPVPVPSDQSASVPSSQSARVPGGQSAPVPGQEPSTEYEPVTEEPTTSPAEADDPDDSPFPDVATEETIEQARQLCRTLAAYVKRNGHALPTTSSARDGWLVEMERLVRIGPPGDVDWPDDPAAAAAEVERVMLWALDVSDFWPANIRSAPTLRAKFTQLRAQANRSNGRRGRTPTGDEYREIAAELRRMGR